MWRAPSAAFAQAAGQFSSRVTEPKIHQCHRRADNPPRISNPLREAKLSLSKAVFVFFSRGSSSSLQRMVVIVIVINLRIGFQVDHFGMMLLILLEGSRVVWW